jgi:hypothetical protein
MPVFRNVVACSLVEVYRRFRHTYWLHNQGDITNNIAAVLVLSFITNFKLQKKSSPSLEPTTVFVFENAVPTISPKKEIFLGEVLFFEL